MSLIAVSLSKLKVLWRLALFYFMWKPRITSCLSVALHSTNELVWIDLPHFLSCRQILIPAWVLSRLFLIQQIGAIGRRGFLFPISKQCFPWLYLTPLLKNFSMVPHCSPVKTFVGVQSCLWPGHLSSPSVSCPCLSCVVAKLKPHIASAGPWSLKCLSPLSFIKY